MAKHQQGVGGRKQRNPPTASAFVGAGPHFASVGPLTDICMDGLTFRCKARKKQRDGLSMTDRDFYFSYVRFRTVSDTKIPKSPSECTSTRQCTVQFGDLTRPTRRPGSRISSKPPRIVKTQSNLNQDSGVIERVWFCLCSIPSTGPFLISSPNKHPLFLRSMKRFLPILS
jgi:hypothetical protein